MQSTKSVNHQFHFSTLFRAISRDAGIILLTTVIVKGTAFFKDILVAKDYGLTSNLDLFLFSFSLVELFLSVLSGALHYAFIPILIRVQLQKDKKIAQQLFSSLISFVLLTSVSLCLFIFIIGPAVIPYLHLGFSPERITKIIHLLYFLFPLLIILSLSALSQGILQAQKQFWVSGLARIGIPFVTTILLLFFHTEDSGTEILMQGAWFGVMIEWFILYRGVRRMGYHFIPQQIIWSSELRQLLKQAGTLSLGSICVSIGLLIDRSFALNTANGAVSALTYGTKVSSVFLTFVAYALSGSLLPTISELWNKHQYDLCRKLIWRITFLIAVASSIFFFPLSLYSIELTTMLYGRGKFSPEDAKIVGEVQQFFLIAVPFILMGIPANRLIVSMGRNDILAYSALIGLLLTYLFDSAFVPVFGIQGIGLSTLLVQALLSIIFLFSIEVQLSRKKRSILFEEIKVI
jgi:putative peptidoglycan lipid II flippase